MKCKIKNIFYLFIFIYFTYFTHAVCISVHNVDLASVSHR